jgi:hypothetical protein
MSNDLSFNIIEEKSQRLKKSKVIDSSVRVFKVYQNF